MILGRLFLCGSNLNEASKSLILFKKAAKCAR